MAKSPKSTAPAEDVPTSNDISVQGVIFTVPTRYSEGHSCSKAEAAALQQVLAENLRNNFANKVKAAKEAGGGNVTGDALNALRVDFATYCAGYEFQGKRTRAPVDPIGREAHKIAKAMVVAALKQKNIDTKSLAEGQMDKLVEGLIAKKPEIREEAERRINATAQVASEALDLLDVEPAPVAAE